MEPEYGFRSHTQNYPVFLVSLFIESQIPNMHFEMFIENKVSVTEKLSR